MMNVISSEIYKVFKSKIFYGILIVFLLMNTITFISGCSITSEAVITGISVYQQSYDADGMIYIILVFVAFLITAEYANGSIRQMACRGIERWKLIVGQYIAISLVTTVIILGFGFVNLLSFTMLYRLGEVDITTFIYMNLGIICTVWASTAFATFLAYVFKNVGITIIVSIVLAKGSELIPSLFSMFTENNILTMYGLTNMRKIIINFASTPEQIMKCCWVLMLIAIVAIWGSCLVFSKMDID